MNTSYRLVLKSGPSAGQIYPLEGPELVIGREPSCEVSINDPEVSRRHARLYLQGVNYVLEDLGSTNGTSINGQRLVGPYILRAGEMVTLGENTHLLFEQVVFDPDATVVAVRQAYTSVPQTPPSAQEPVVSYQAPPAEVNYAGQIPPQTPKDVKKKKLTPMIIVLIVLVIILLCGCVAFGIFDFLNLYCDFPGITNFFIPGACPP